jgi:hypothetical protein
VYVKYAFQIQSICKHDALELHSQDDDSSLKTKKVIKNNFHSAAIKRPYKYLIYFELIGKFLSRSAKDRPDFGSVLIS